MKIFELLCNTKDMVLLGDDLEKMKSFCFVFLLLWLVVGCGCRMDMKIRTK